MRHVSSRLLPPPVSSHGAPRSCPRLTRTIPQATPDASLRSPVSRPPVSSLQSPASWHHFGLHFGCHRFPGGGYSSRTDLKLCKSSISLRDPPRTSKSVPQTTPGAPKDTPGAPRESPERYQRTSLRPLEPSQEHPLRPLGCPRGLWTSFWSSRASFWT